MSPSSAPLFGDIVAGRVSPSSGELRGVVQDVVVEPRPVAPGTAKAAEEPQVRRVLRTPKGTVPLTAGALPGNRSGDVVDVRLGEGSSSPTGTVTGAGAPSGPPPAARRPRGAAASAPTTEGGGAAATVASARTVQSAAAGITSPGERSVYIALVAPKGLRPDPELTPDRAAAAMRKASDYWSSQTRGRVSFTIASINGWTTSRRQCSDVFGLWDEVQARIPASAGAHRHLVLVLPRSAVRDPSCYYGYATVGTAGSGGSVSVADLNQSVLAHELGHNLGLHHANSLLCPTRQDAVYSRRDGWPAGCLAREYDDLFDVMGFSGPGFGEGNLNGPHVDVMGMQPGAVRRIGEGTTQAFIAPVGHIDTERRILRIDDPGGVYYVEYRAPNGRDSAALNSPSRPSSGVRILRADPQYRYATGSYELDATPEVRPSYRRSLSPGRTFTSASGRVTVTVRSQSSEGAVVVVTVAKAFRALPAKVTISVPGKLRLGRKITTTTRVTGKKDAVVAGWSVSLERAVGRRWRTVATTVTGRRGTATVSFRHSGTPAYRWITAPTSRVPSRVSPLARVTTVRG